MSSLKVEMVAADRKVWEGEATFVRARSTAGELGIMPGHSPLLGILVEGEVTINARRSRSTKDLSQSTPTWSPSSPNTSTPRRCARPAADE